MGGATEAVSVTGTCQECSSICAHPFQVGLQASALKKFFKTTLHPSNTGKMRIFRCKPSMIELGINALSDTLAEMRRPLILGIGLVCGLGCASHAEDHPEASGGSGGEEGAALDGTGGSAVASGGSSAQQGTGGERVVGVGGTASTGGSMLGSGGSSGGSDGGTGGAASSSGGAGSGPSCAYSGRISYQLINAETWPSEARMLITEAIEEALYYYNCYADLTQSLTINYNPSVPTAEANVDGRISFGDDPGYMQVATAMHEIAHTLGIGYFPWTELTQDGKWTGAHVVELITQLPASERDPDQYSQRTYITADAQHFWPYGLNQASEHQSEWSLINHVRIVAAMQLDKQDYTGN